MVRTRPHGPATRLAFIVACLLVSVMAATTPTAGAAPATAGKGAVATAAGIAAVPAAPSSGCATSSVGAGDQTITLTSGGVDRTYIRHVPPAHDGATPVPLVLALHGLGEGSVLHQQMSDYAPRADANGFVVAYPQALGSPAAWQLAGGSPDVAFVTAVLDDLEATLCLDTNRIYLSGFSLGAMLTSTLMCGDVADRIAAAAPIAGTRNPAGCAPTRSVPMITFHGTVDNWVPYASAPPAIAAWAARNGCDPTPTSTPVPGDDVVTIDHIQFVCPQGAEVEWYSITGGGHAWPGSDFSRAIVTAVGYTTFAIEATDLVWAFFEDHPLPAAPGAIRGTVTGPDGEPVPGATVAAFAPTDSWTPTAQVVTGPDGSYEIAGLPAGSYEVSFLPVPVPGLRSEWFESSTRAGATPVIVTAAGVTAPIDAELDAAAAITGTVLDEGGDPIAGAPVWAFAPGDLWIGSGFAVTDADGDYAIEGLHDDSYDLRFVAPDPSHAGEWFDDASNARQATPVVVTAGAPSPVADATLAAAGSIRGVVNTPTTPAAGVTVHAFGTTDGYMARATAVTDDLGSYVIEGLRPGTYRVRFVPPSGSGLRPEWSSNATSRSAATPIVVGAGDPPSFVDEALRLL